MRAGIGFILFVLSLVFFSAAVFAQVTPQGPDSVTEGADQRRADDTTGTAVQAQAGNVTSLTITSTRVTNRWQGYFGNVTGTITLDDANSNSLYNWQLASPQGEVYASNGSASGTVVWGNVFCFNYTNNLSGGQSNVQRFNGTEIESMIGAGMGDVDNHNATFNSTFSGSFQVGSTTIDSTDSCRQTTLFVNDAYQTTDFTEVLLTDNNSIIYTSLLEQNAVGFQGAPVDFQMIVGENGNTVAAMNYYFFVELS